VLYPAGAPRRGIARSRDTSAPSPLPNPQGPKTPLPASHARTHRARTDHEALLIRPRNAPCCRQPPWCTRHTRLHPAWQLLAADGVAAAREHARHGRLDAGFLDLGLPDGDGLALIRELREAAIRPARCWSIAVFAEEQRAQIGTPGGRRLGLHPQGRPGRPWPGGLIATVEAGGSPASPAIARAAHRAGCSLPADCGRVSAGTAAGTGERLSAREAEMLAPCSKGLRYAEIASALALSVHTVNAHLKSVYRKLMVNSRAEAVYEARRAGLLHDERRGRARRAGPDARPPHGRWRWWRQPCSRLVAALALPARALAAAGPAAAAAPGAVLRDRHALRSSGLRVGAGDDPAPLDALETRPVVGAVPLRGGASVAPEPSRWPPSASR
jgi:DNA-binding NarL/FixJ family response regulator